MKIQHPADRVAFLVLSALSGCMGANLFYSLEVLIMSGHAFAAYVVLLVAIASIGGAVYFFWRAIR